EARQSRLDAQPVHAGLYSTVASRMAPAACGGAEVGGREAASSSSAPPPLFRQCRLYFNGRVDCGDGLSNYSLGKLARLHGAEVTVRLTKRGVTHVVCTQLAVAKEHEALKGASRRGALYFVKPDWIVQSIAARARLPESRYSLVAQVAQGAGCRAVAGAAAPAAEASRAPAGAAPKGSGCGAGLKSAQVREAAPQ
ncbi:unnamed protein product, partial [Prorocentrum cordatum]